MELPILLLALLGFGISFFLYDHRTSKKANGTLSMECVHALKSPYAKLWYLHSTLWGMVSFGVLFFAATIAGVATGVMREGFGLLTLILVVFNAVVSLLMMGLLLTVVRRYCGWCFLLQVVAFVCFILVII